MHTRLLCGAISALLLQVSGVDVGAASVSPTASHGFRYSRTDLPRLVQFGAKHQSRTARPDLKKPLLSKNPPAFQAAKAKAQQSLDRSASPGTSPAKPKVAAPLSPPTGSTLETLTSFPAMGLEQQVADMGRDQVDDPADTQVAVGPNYVAEVVNGNISVWTKAGARVATEDLATFFSVPNNFVFTDPNLLYDAQSGHWFMSGMAFNASFNSVVYAGVSVSTDPTGTWTVYTVNSLTGVLQDQPGLGNSDDKIAIAWSDFFAPCSPICAYGGAEIWVLQKSDMIAGLAGLRTARYGPTANQFAIVPARSQTSTTTQYLVYNNSDGVNLVENTGGPTAGLISITGTPATSTSISEVDPNMTPTTLPANAQQPGGAPSLQTNDDRFLSAVWRNGILSVAANDGCPSSSIPTSCARIMRIETSGTNLIPLSTDIGGVGDFVYFPAVSVDASGDLFATYTESSGQEYPTLVALAFQPNGNPTSIGIVAGTASVNTKVCGGTNRWGDYSGAAQDPADPTDVWVAGEYGASTTDPCDWRTAIGRITLSAPTISGFTPAQATSSGATPVVITGSDFVPGNTTVSFPSGPATNVTVQSPHQLTAVTAPASGTPAGPISVMTSDGSASSSTNFKFVPFNFSPSPIAPNGSLAANQPVTVNLTPGTGGPAQSYLSFIQGPGGGSACVVTSGGPTTCPTPLPSTDAMPYPPDANGHIVLHYTPPGAVLTNGLDTLHVQDTATGTPATNTLDDTYTLTPVVTNLAFATPPIAPEGDLVGGMSTSVVLTATDATRHPVPNTTIDLSFVPIPGGAVASVQNTALSNGPNPYATDGNGQIAIIYTTPQTLPAAGGTDTIHAISANGTASAQDSYTFPPVTTFYFAEGFTANGFKEILSLLMPNESGTVILDAYTESGHSRGFAFLTAGEVEPVDINAAVGANHQVSMKVTLPGPGVAERTLHFNFGSWYGSTDTVGVTAPSTSWYFAEGSTLSFFSEYLTLQNPNSGPVPTTLQYYTDSGLTPTKTLTLPANSRTTVAVFDGDTTNPGTDCLITGGNAANCGVGRGIAGVSVRITATGSSIIAERPFYVNNFSFGSGPVRDGHDAFGANAPATTWNFAEGTTLGGFNEYLTLQNANPTPTTAQLHYFTGPGVAPAVKTLTLPANSRVTVEVFRGDLTTNTNCSPSGGTCGVGPGVVGVSTQVTSNQPIVAERPMYMYFNFGSGPVAGAHVVVGANALAQLFGFSWASTLTADNDYLTIQNPGGSTANITATYYTGTGVAVQHFPVAPSSRQTVELFQSAEGAGPGIYPLGIVIQSDRPVMVEKPTYSRNTATYGATDTLGYSPPTGGF